MKIRVKVAQAHRVQRDLLSILSLVFALLALLVAVAPAKAQEVRIRDLTVEDRAVPVRLMGYGIVVGLDNSGDRVLGGKQGGMTVNSVVNLLKRFDVEVPAEVMRMRNVAAVLVTAEVSPYLRAGGRFEIHVSSVGDARSLRGGVLWMTPLLADVGGKPVASAQGALLISEAENGTYRAAYASENTARIPTGGLLETDMARPQFASTSRLVLREPDVGTAARIAAAINKVMGDTTAKVEDPGSIALLFKADEKRDRATLLSQIRDVLVRPDRPSRLVIDARDGTVVAGGEITVSDASVSHGGISLAVGAMAAADSTAPRDTTAGARGGLHVASGTPVSKIVSALHAMQTPPSEIAAILESLRSVGALSAEVVIR
ncbi:MAG: flagellar basal body P-ring protein FlgI [bacterium]